MNQLLHWMLLWTKLTESQEVLLSQLAGYSHQTMNCLMLIVMISMCPQHLVYSRWESQSMVVITALWLQWLRTPVMYAWALPSLSLSQSETGVERIVPLLMHPTPSVSFGIYVPNLGRGHEVILICHWYGQMSSKSENQDLTLLPRGRKVPQICVSVNQNTWLFSILLRSVITSQIQTSYLDCDWCS